MATRRTVKALATLTGVSVRALHHYDEIGLLRPSARSAKGYRLYDERDLLRLQQILVRRALGLSLDEIRRELDDPRFDLRAALVAQRLALAINADRGARMLRAIDRALERLDGEETPMDDEAMFDGFNPHAEEARARWGATEAYKESARRTARYTPDDWAAMRAEQGAIYRDLAAAMARGLAPGDPAVQPLVARHRAHIDRWFYPCDVEMQRNLASLYEADPRFAASLDAHAEGLTAFVVAAIRAG